MITPRHSHAAILLPDGRVLVAGGTSLDDPPDSAELYDPATGTWTAIASMHRLKRPTARPRCCSRWQRCS